MLSFAGHVHGILVAEVASEPSKGWDPLDPLGSRADWAGWNCSHPISVVVSQLLYLTLAMARAQSFSSSPRGAF